MYEFIGRIEAARGVVESIRFSRFKNFTMDSCLVRIFSGLNALRLKENREKKETKKQGIFVIAFIEVEK